MLFYGWKEVKMVDWLVLEQMLVLGFGKSSFLDDLYNFRAMKEKESDYKQMCILFKYLVYHIESSVIYSRYIKDSNLKRSSLVRLFNKELFQ